MKQRNHTVNSIRRALFSSRLTTVSMLLVSVLVVIALFAPILANNKPLYVNIDGHVFFPAFSGDEYADIPDKQSRKITRIKFSEITGATYEHIRLIMPPVPWAPHKSDLDNAGYTSPAAEQYRYEGSKKIPLEGFEKHLLGTGKRGEDLLSGLIHGTRISLTVGLFSMFIAGLLGILLGSAAGYFGDQGFKIARGKMVMMLIGIIPAWFYGFQIRAYSLMDSLQQSPFAFAFQLCLSLVIFALVLALFYLSGNLLKILPYFKKHVSLPVDSIISRLIEILISLPSLILIISIAAIARPSLVNLILIIGLTSWTDIARLTRAEILRLKNLEFIETARSMGFRETRILFRHALPNAVGPAMVAIAFGIASAILAESSLSFLGIGVPQDMVTWGSLLASGRENFQAWWLVVFPGIAIFLTVTAYNIIGEGLRDAMDPRLRK